MRRRWRFFLTTMLPHFAEKVTLFLLSFCEFFLNSLYSVPEAWRVT